MATEHAQPKAVGFTEAILNNLLIIVIAGLLGLGLGVAASQKMDAPAQATTSILLNPLEGNPFYPSTRGEDLVNLGTEAQALRSDQVAEIVAAAQEGETESDPETLLGNLDVGVPVNTQILEVSYSARNPDTAVAMSQAFAESYLAYRQQRAEDRIAGQVAQLDAQLAANSESLNALSVELATLDEASPRAGVVRQQMDGLTTQSATLSAKKAELATTPLDPGQVVAPAALAAGSPFSPKLLLPIAGLLGGLMLGLAIALLRSRADVRVHRATDVRDAGFSVLGTLGDLPPGTPSSGPLHDERVDDEFRRIRVALLAQRHPRPMSMLISSASSESIAPVSAIDLGISLARSGVDTLIIDATTGGRGPGFILGGRAEVGLSDVLSGTTTFDEAVHAVGPMLWVLGPGERRAEAADLLTGGEMSRVMSLAGDRADVIILAGDSVQFGDAQSLASVVDNVVIEVDQGRTTTTELDRAARALELLPSITTGAIFVGKDATVRTSPFTPTIIVNRGQLPRASPPSLPPISGGSRPTPPDDADRPDSGSTSEHPVSDDAPTGHAPVNPQATEQSARVDAPPARPRRRGELSTERGNPTTPNGQRTTRSDPERLSPEGTAGNTR